MSPIMNALGIVVFLLSLQTLSLEPFNFIQLTDFHEDPNYIKNAAPSHNCQEDDLKVDSNAYFGRYGCDSPQNLIEFMLERAKDAVYALPKRPPFILLSGDLITHHLAKHLNITQSVFDIFQETSKELRHAFPDIPVLLALGNNDALHHNQAPTLAQKRAFYSVLFQNFFNKSDAIRSKFSQNKQEWKELQRTYMDGGYYKYKQSQKLTVIALNTNYWHASNWETNDYYSGWNQIYFLQNTLSSLGADEQVIILGHIFPGFYFKNEVFWNQTYVDRFRNAIWNSHEKIIGLLAAHTHHGDVRTIKEYNYGFLQGPLTYLFGSLTSLWSSDQMYNSYLSMLIAPAVSPVYGNNPGFRTFYVDTQGSQKYYLHSYNDCFLDIYQTIRNMQSTFRTAKRSFNFCYNSTQFMENLKPATLDQFNDKLYEDQNLLYDWLASKSGYNPFNKGRADELINDNYKENQIVNIPKNEWNCQFWCYSQFVIADEYEACVAKKKAELNS